MAFTDGIICPDLLELSTGDYSVAPISVFADGIECPDLLGLSQGNYVAPVATSFTDGIECPDLLGLSQGNYVNSGVKAFTQARDLFISVRQYIPGDDSIEIIVGLYLDFDASPRFGEAPLVVDFINRSSEFFTNWQWSFGDQKYSIAKDPTHTYKLPGSYDVTLRARLYPDWYSLAKRR